MNIQEIKAAVAELQANGFNEDAFQKKYKDVKSFEVVKLIANLIRLEPYGRELDKNLIRSNFVNHDFISDSSSDAAVDAAIDEALAEVSKFIAAYKMPKKEAPPEQGPGWLKTALNGIQNFFNAIPGVMRGIGRSIANALPGKSSSKQEAADPEKEEVVIESKEPERIKPSAPPPATVAPPPPARQFRLPPIASEPPRRPEESSGTKPPRLGGHTDDD